MKGFICVSFLVYLFVNEISTSPIETSLVDYEESNDIIAECKLVLTDCITKAGTIQEKAHCLVDVGKCIGEKAAVCAKPCLMPFAMCQMAAGVTWPALMKCGKEFLSCSVVACMKNEETLPVEYDFSPIEAAVADLAESNTIVDECKGVLTDCITKAGTLKEKAHCFVDLGVCVGEKAAVCAKECLMPFAMCQMAAGVTWPAIVKCGKSFLSCSVASCMKNEAPTNMVSIDDEMSPYEFAIQAVDDNSVSFTECKKEFFTCIKTGEGITGKLQCFKKMGKCIGGELIGCSAHCIPQFALCKYEAKGSWIKTAFCAVKFLTCAKEGCINE